MKCGRFVMHGCGCPHEDSAFDIEFSEEMMEGGRCQLVLHVYPRDGCDTVTVDWGDGSVERCSDTSAWHDYTEARRYAVRIGKEARHFQLWSCYKFRGDGRTEVRCAAVFPRWWGDFVESARATYGGWNDPLTHGVQGRVIPWGRSITDASFCYQKCKSVTGSYPRWTNRITSAVGTFEETSGMSGRVPKWGCSARNVAQCFSGCTGLAGPLPAWPPSCEEFDYCFAGCEGLVGHVPPWPRAARTLREVFRGCAGLAGEIPPWPDGVTELSGCYRDCAGLTGAWTDDPALLMPEAKLQDGWLNRSWDVVTGCSDSLRALFWDKNWGGTIPRPIPLPEG